MKQARGSHQWAAPWVLAITMVLLTTLIHGCFTKQIEFVLMCTHTPELNCHQLPLTIILQDPRISYDENCDLFTWSLGLNKSCTMRRKGNNLLHLLQRKTTMLHVKGLLHE